MTFAGINYLAVIIAAIVGFAAGAAWYMALGKPWMEAHGFTQDSMKANQSPVPFIIALAANLVMAWMLAGIIGHLGIGEVNLKNGVISGALIWFGFVLTTIAVNYSFGKRSMKLLAMLPGNTGPQLSHTQ